MVTSLIQKIERRDTPTPQERTVLEEVTLDIRSFRFGPTSLSLTKEGR